MISFTSLSASDSDNLVSLDHKRNVSDRVVCAVGRKWKRSDSSDSYSVALMTPLTTSIFDFHQVISTYKSTYDSDSNSVASENQPFQVFLTSELTLFFRHVLSALAF